MEHLLVMHYEEKLDQSEYAQVEQWISESDENKKIYEETIFIWKNAKGLKNDECLNIELEWNKFSHTRNILENRHLVK